MGDEVGATYFSYQGPSQSEASNNSQENRNTVRSIRSEVSDKGENNEITTLAVRPYQGSIPFIPGQQSILWVSPPTHPLQSYPHYPGIYNKGYSMAIGPFKPTTIDDTLGYPSIARGKAHSDFREGTDTLKICAILMGIIVLLVLITTIFMAIYYGDL